MQIETPFQIHSRVVAYLRDSGGEDQELSIPQQKEAVIKWCHENQLVLTAIYADEARPGSSVIGRNQFISMIEYFQGESCLDQGVIFWKYSRFSRDVDDAQYYRSLLRIKGYIVYSIQDKIPDDDFGRLYETVIDFSNSKFLKDLSDDVKRGLKHILLTYGALPGKPPRGFRREPVEIGKRRDGSAHTACRWVIDEDMKEKVQQAWLMRASGVSIKEIHSVTHLFSSRNSYTTFFTNRLYLGELHYGDQVIENYSEPLITKEIWDAVQGINTENSDENSPRRHPKRENSGYILSGIVHCDRCGSQMNGKTITTKKTKSPMSYYHCPRSGSKMDCDARNIPQKDLENLVLSTLEEYILDPGTIADRADQIAEMKRSSLLTVLDEKKTINQRINDQKIRLENISNKIADDPDAPKTLIAKMKEIEKDIESMQARLAEIRMVKSDEIFVPIDQKRAAELSQYLIFLINSDDTELKRSIVRSLIKTVAVHRDNKEIRGIVVYYNPDGT